MPGTELAKAYVQIVPSTEGMKGMLQDLFEKELDVAEPLRKSMVQGLLGGINDILNGRGKSVLESGLATLLNDAGMSAAAAGPVAGIAMAVGGALAEAGKTAAKVTAQVVKGVAEGGAAVAGLGISGAAMLGKSAVENYAVFEQVSDGARKIFDEMDYSEISKDAFNAFKELNLSANDYLSSINITGATFAQTMGDKKGYETARKGMKAVSDFSAGTGKNLALLNEKYQMISRSASVYQSIADQFAGILPQTSADFLAQAQAAGLLSTEYKKLTAVPVAEYQEAVTEMLARGVDALGFTGKTAQESLSTITGSLNMTKAAWDNLLTGLADPEIDLKQQTDNLLESILGAFNEDGTREGGLLKNIVPRFKEAVTQIGPALKELLPELSGELVDLMRDEELTDALLDGAGSLIDGALDALPEVLDAALDRAPDLMGRFAGWIGENLPKLTETLTGTLAAHSGELSEAATGLVTSILTSIETATGAEDFSENMKAIIEPLIDKAVMELPKWIHSAFVSAGNIGKLIWDVIQDEITKNFDWWGAMMDLVSGMLFHNDNTEPITTGALGSGMGVTSPLGSGIGVTSPLGSGLLGDKTLPKVTEESGKAADSLKTTDGAVKTLNTSSSATNGTLQIAARNLGLVTEGAGQAAPAAGAAAGSVGQLGGAASTAAGSIGAAATATDAAGGYMESLSGSTAATGGALDGVSGSAAAAAPAVDGVAGSAAAAGDSLTQAAVGAQTFSSAVASLSADAFGAGFDFMTGFAQGLEGGGYLTETAVAATVGTVEQLSALAGPAGGWGTEISFSFAIGIRAGQGMVSAAVDGIKGVCEELAAFDAEGWGYDLAQSFAQGIFDGYDMVAGAVSGLANMIHSMLGFSEPETGPLSDFHTYAPDMMALFAKGVAENEALVRDQVARSFDFADMTAAPSYAAERYDEETLDRVVELLELIARNSERGGLNWNDLLNGVNRGMGDLYYAAGRQNA